MWAVCQSVNDGIQYFGCNKDCCIATKMSSVFLCLGSMFVTSWWKVMGSSAPQSMSSISTPAQRKSSADISSLISKVQFSKTTYMWVCSMLCGGDISCSSWHMVTYLFWCLGRFIHAILQPILSTLKSGVKSVVVDPWFVFVTVIMFRFFCCHCFWNL